LNKAHEIELARTGLIDFSDFLDFKSNISVEGDGEVYPDVYSEFDKGKGDGNKKGKGKKAATGNKESSKA